MKRVLIALVLAVIIVFQCVCVSADAITVGNYSYTVLEDGTAEITKYSGSDSNVNIVS